MADPYPALSTVRSRPVLRSHYRNAGVVTTVDAVNALGLLDTRLEALRQIGAADLLVLTKTDLVAPGRVSDLVARLASVKPSARVVTASEATAADFLADASDTAPAPSASLSHHRHATFLAETPVTSFSLEIEEPVDWTGFGLWLTMLLDGHGENVFRVKGILNLQGEERPVAVHGVQRLVHSPVHLERWPDDRRASRLVFIVNGLDHARIEASFRAFDAMSRRVTARGSAA